MLVRRALLLLTAIGAGATAFELATERHWNGLVQLIPWFALAVLVLALGLAVRAGRRATVAARVLAVLVLAVSLYGVAEHVVVNHGSGPLDQAFSDAWDTLPMTTRWWYAVTKTVGPAPVLAPGVLGQQALLLLLATFVRPGATSGSRRRAVVGRGAEGG